MPFYMRNRSHQSNILFRILNLGEYSIINAFMVSSGSDLACFSGFTTNVTILTTFGEDGTINGSSEAVFATSFVANIAAEFEGDEEFVPNESNKVSLNNV